MGRKRTPTKLKIVKGTDQKCRMNADEPEPEIAIPDPPGHLGEYAIEEWNRITPELKTLGIISKDRMAVIAAYCTAYQLWRDAWEALNNLSDPDNPTRRLLSLTTNGNMIQNPLIGIANKAAGDMVRFASEIGITPASAPKVVANKPKGGNDPWDDL